MARVEGEGGVTEGTGVGRVEEQPLVLGWDEYGVNGVKGDCLQHKHFGHASSFSSTLQPERGQSGHNRPNQSGSVKQPSLLADKAEPQID